MRGTIWDIYFLERTLREEFVNLIRLTEHVFKMANNLLLSVKDCLNNYVYSSQGRLDILEKCETECLSGIINLFKFKISQAKRGKFRYCEVSRLQFPDSQRQRAGSRQAVR